MNKYQKKDRVKVRVLMPQKEPGVARGERWVSGEVLAVEHNDLFNDSYIVYVKPKAEDKFPFPVNMAAPILHVGPENLKRDVIEHMRKNKK